MPRSALLLVMSSLILASCAVPEFFDRAPTPAPVTTSATDTCRGADDDIAALCEAIGLIESRYIDPIDDSMLASVADGALDGLDTAAQPPSLVCGTSQQAVDRICRELDDADVDLAEGVEAVLDAIAIHTLDPYSEYLNPDELVEAAAQTRGQVEGIGALVAAEDTSADEPERSSCAPLGDTCHMILVSVFEGGPADDAGIASGDRLLAVDGVPVDGRTLDEVTEQVRGPAGSDVGLELLRDERYTVTVTRAAVDVPVVETTLIGDVGYLRLSIFTDASSRQVTESLTALIEDGAESIVVDLRNNPGGTLDSAVEITSEFLTDGVVVRTESPDEEVPYAVTGTGVATDGSLPVFVLINRGSASAAEVMAGALGESDRATIIGEASFGKNTVQQRFGLDNGGAIKMTVARWVTPDGYDFGETGITPDVTAELPTDLSPEEVVAEVQRLVG